jgi:AraC-like DNA-binding protein
VHAVEAGQGDGYAPIQGISGGLTGPVRDAAVDFVQIGFVRRGRMTVIGRFGRQQVERGELVTLEPQTPVDVVPGPEGVEYTTIFVDRELLYQSAAWEFPTRLRGRSDAERYFRHRYPDGFKWARIGELLLRDLEPCLDELDELTRGGQLPARFKRAAAILFTVLDAIGPALEPPETALPAAVGLTSRPPEFSVPRRRPLQPLRPEVHRVIALLESDLAHPWRSDDLAATVGLSAGHLRQLFLDGLGRTPLAYQNLLRAHRAQELLLDRSRSIPDVMAEVGWTSPSHWTAMFRRHTGMTPREYRDQT